MFKVSKEDLTFALTLCSKALAQRQQEELVYRAVRITTFEASGKHYVAFATNGGYNAVKTAGFEIKDFKQDIDVMVEAAKLLEVVSKSTVDSIGIKKLDEDNILVTANGENKIRFIPGETIPEFALFEAPPIGSMKVKQFVRHCKLATPFATDDIHKEALLGLCIDNGSMYATDEFKGITIENIGLNFPNQLSFNAVATDMVKMFAEDSDVEFYLGKMESADDFTHFVCVVGGVEMFILKYANEFPSRVFQELNKKCRAKNIHSATAGKSDILQCLNRISVFVDENDLMGITFLQGEQAGCLMLEAITAKSGEQSMEEIEATLEADDSILGKKTHVSFSGFKTMVDSSENPAITIKLASDSQFVSLENENHICWLMIKRVN